MTAGRVPVAVWLAGLVVVLLVVAAVALRLVEDLGGADPSRGGRDRGPVAVEVAQVTTGSIAEGLTIAGGLTPSATFIVSPEVGGRLVAMQVDVGDEVRRGMEIARIEDARYRQAVVEAEAAVAVARARLNEAQSSVGVSQRRAERSRSLVERGVLAEADRDDADAARLGAEAAVAVAEAEVQQAEAALAAAQLRLADTRIVADWSDGDETRVVGERWVDAGETVAAGEALVSILEIDPVEVDVQVTERAYGRIAIGQEATLRTDAYPEERFAAVVVRIAPRFNPASRQALIELQAPNADGRLKPGMFVRAELELDRREDATLVPEAALVGRRGDPAVFLVAEDGASVSRVPVTIGLRHGDQVEIRAPTVQGRVVTLGHHLLADGSAITIPTATDRAAETQ